MSIAGTRVLILLAAGLIGLAGCSSFPKFGEFGDGASTATADNAAAATDNAAPADHAAAADTTGSIVTQPAEPGPSGEPVAPLAKPGLLGDDANDDLQLGKKYFRSNNFALAEKSFRAAVEKHPNDAEAWVGLGASYDRLRRFDLADRAYAQAERLIGRTVELLNDEGFSFMLRGDYARAKKLLEQAQAKDPANPYVQANLQLLNDSIHDR